MKFKASLWLLSLIPIALFAFQNCGSFTALGADSLASSNSDSSADSSNYVDGLPPGLSQNGSTFKRDPGSSSGNYVLPFSSDLSAYVVPTTIRHLQSAPNLNDGFANFAYDDAYPTIFADPNGSLAFATSDSRFDQVNAYFHVDRLIADLAGQNLFPSPYPLLKVNTHCQQTNAKDNSFYSFDDHLLCLGYTDIGTQRIWAAKDADVVVHEFGHSINHKYTTDIVWASTSDNGAMDEAFADLWAYRQNRGNQIAMWFGRAIYVAAGYTVYNTNVFPGLRDLSRIKTYPTDLQYEKHTDSEFVSAPMKEIETNAGFSLTQMAKFEKYVIESLQTGHGIGDAVLAIQDAAAALGVPSAVTSAALSSRALLRKDLISEVVLDSSKPAYVIDNHQYKDFQSGGNCNGALDAGETVLIYPNLRNLGAIKGEVRVEISSPTPSVSFLAGGNFGLFPRLPADGTYLSTELGSASRTSTTYLGRLLSGSLAVRIAAGATGTAHFDLRITSMNTQDSVLQSATRSFDLPIGSSATVSGPCTGAGEMSAWP